MSSAPIPNRHPPFLQVTPSDHGAWVAVATALGLCCALVTLTIRVFVRVVISPPLGRDDTAVLAATGFAAIQSSVVLHGVCKGLGKSVDLISTADLQAVEKAAYASDILYLFSAYLSKCSVIFLLLRLTSNPRHRIAFRTTLAASTVWLIASIFAIALRCDLSQPWVLFQQKCTALLLRWQIVIAFDVIDEVVIFAMSYYLIHGLHMALRNKFIVIGAFGFRLTIIPFLIIRLISFPRHHLSTNPAFTLTYFYVWSQTTLYISLMTSMVPCLKPFVAGLHTGYGAFDTEHVATQVLGSYGSNGYASRGRRVNHSTNLPNRSAFDSTNGPSSLGGDGIEKQRATVDTGVGSPTSGHRGRPSQSVTVLRNMGLGLDPRVAGQDEENGGGKAINHTSAVAQDGNSIGSNDSQQMIIRKDISWEVGCSAP